MLKIVTLTVGLAMAALTPAAAATYKVDSFVNGWDAGFGSTLFHEASGCSAMCGSVLDSATGTGSGLWDSTTGAINFVMDLVGGGTATALGTLGLTSRTDGIAGALSIVIAGSQHGKDGTHSFVFRDHTYNTVANLFDGSIIGLWGAAGGTANSHNAGFSNADMGVDFRIQVSPVPLPAGMFLLLTGLGGLLVARRRTNAARRQRGSVDDPKCPQGTPARDLSRNKWGTAGLSMPRALSCN